MARILALLGALALVSSFGTFVHPPSPTSVGPPGTSSVTMTLWEAYSRGYISIHQVDLSYHSGGQTVTAPLGYEVRNSGSVSVVIDEHAVLLSPNPRENRDPADTSQDAILTYYTIPPNGVVDFGYGDFVANGILAGPAWWCSEAFQYVKSGVSIALGGEIAPFALTSLLGTLQGGSGGTQDQLWADLASAPTVVVGKTVNGAFWLQVPEFPAQSLTVDLRATNLAIKNTQDNDPDPDAPNARVWDVVPAGYTIDFSTVHPAGYATTMLADGSTRISWDVNLPAADITGRNPSGVPTPFVSRDFGYRMTLPHIHPGRVSLPRSQVSVGADFTAEANSEMPVMDVFRVERPPVAIAGGPYEANEGDSIAFSAIASADPNDDPLQFRWDFTADGTWDTPWSSDASASMTFGDDFSGAARVQVTDGEMNASAEAPVVIHNVAPTIDGLRATAGGNLTLRVAGEKWHDVTLTLSQGGVSTSVSVVRMPGSPDRQEATLGDVELDLSQDVAITLTYTPADDPVNGQPNGADPVWVIFDTAGGEVQLQHTFNVQHPDTWTWHLDDIAPQLIGLGIRLAVTASDVGSDDLSFSVDWGDGTTNDRIVYNDGAGPDPFPSVDVHPIRAAETFPKAYAAASVYTVRVTVTDDDGGVAVATLLVRLG